MNHGKTGAGPTEKMTATCQPNRIWVGLLAAAAKQPIRDLCQGNNYCNTVPTDGNKTITAATSVLLSVRVTGAEARKPLSSDDDTETSLSKAASSEETCWRSQIQDVEKTSVSGLIWDANCWNTKKAVSRQKKKRSDLLRWFNLNSLCS